MSASDRALLAGDAGDGAALAMRLVVRAAEVTGADRLIDVAGAHVPVVVLPPDELAAIGDGDAVEVDADGVSQRR